MFLDLMQTHAVFFDPFSTKTENREGPGAAANYLSKAFDPFMDLSLPLKGNSAQRPF